MAAHRQLHLNVNVLATGRHNAAWRHASTPKSVSDIQHFIDIAKVAERGTFDAIFFADHQALDDVAAFRPWHALDPSVLISAISQATTYIGLVATSSTTVEEPFHVARKVATIDHVSHGRAALNYVTSQQDSIARNFGYEHLPAHAERYRRATEFVEVVLKLWDSWSDDAVLADVQSGRYVDFQRVRPIAHKGEFFSVAGALNVPRPPQGRPVLVHAGDSSESRNIGARFADAIFTVQRTFDEARAFYQDYHARARGFGRTEPLPLILPGLYPVIAGTAAEARARKDEFDSLLDPTEELAKLAGRFNYKVERLVLDKPLPDDILDHILPTVNRGFLENLVREARREKLTLREVLGRNPIGGHRLIVGGPDEIADEIAYWFNNHAADGFNLNFDAYPSGLELFVEHVVPVLRRHGIFRREYTGTTLRDHLGLARPASHIRAREAELIHEAANRKEIIMTVINNPRTEPTETLSLATPATIAPGDLRAIALSGAELAVVDVREGDAYVAAGHISIAVELPLSELELKAYDLLPRRSVPLVVVDDDGASLAPLAARRLADIGYTDVRVLEGGLAGWQQAGFPLITGQHALSKALGEVVERRDHTPRITAEQLRARFAAGEDFVVLDTRPLEEFNYLSIPDGIAAPGAELLHRVFDAVPSPTTPIVVNCAGRTRAIIGAQALINAGVPNPIVSLENGTAAWLFAGLTPARGAAREAPRPSAEGLAKAKEAQQRLAKRFGISPLSPEALAGFRAEVETRTLYLFDIRTGEEFAAGHLAGSRHVPGGQLVQNTDRFVGSRQGRIVLVDDTDLVRATISASWLLQLGHNEVHVYPATPAELSETGSVAPLLPNLPQPAAAISPLALSRLVAGGGATVLDLDPIAPYHQVRRYIPGSLVARRATLPQRLTAVPGAGPIVLTSKDGALARLAAADLHGLTEREVRVLEGGTDAWIGAALGFHSGSGQPALDPSETVPPPQTLEQRRAYFDAYVAWGHTIGAELERDGLVQFRHYPE